MPIEYRKKKQNQIAAYPSDVHYTSPHFIFTIRNTVTFSSLSWLPRLHRLAAGGWKSLSQWWRGERTHRMTGNEHPMRVALSFLFSTSRFPPSSLSQYCYVIENIKIIYAHSINERTEHLNNIGFMSKYCNFHV